MIGKPEYLEAGGPALHVDSELIVPDNAVDISALHIRYIHCQPIFQNAIIGKCDEIFGRQRSEQLFCCKRWYRRLLLF